MKLLGQVVMHSAGCLQNSVKQAPLQGRLFEDTWQESHNKPWRGLRRNHVCEHLHLSDAGFQSPRWEQGVMAAPENRNCKSMMERKEETGEKKTLGLAEKEQIKMQNVVWQDKKWQKKKFMPISFLIVCTCLAVLRVEAEAGSSLAWTT